MSITLRYADGSCPPRRSIGRSLRAVTFSRTRLLVGAGVLLFFLLIAGPVSAQEICGNGVDDDGNGLVDLNDPGCPCSSVITPAGIASYIRNPSFEVQNCCPYGLTTPIAPWFDCLMDWHQATVATCDYYHSCGNQPAAFPLPPPDGEGAVGFISEVDYKEYVGTCLVWPLPAQPLQAGVTYTLSLWMNVFGGLNLTSGGFGTTTDGFPDAYPLALFGNTNCQPFPLPTLNCVGDLPGWNELGRTYHQVDGDWHYVSITFTPTVTIQSVIIGAPCDLPASFSEVVFMGPEGPQHVTPYTIIDDLLLTVAADQVMAPVTQSGHYCTDDVSLVGDLPPGATGYQWYLEGVALPGYTDPTLDVSTAGLGAGNYTLASTYDGQCLMGGSTVLVPSFPPFSPTVQPDTGCAPLPVILADGVLHPVASALWDLGDGHTASGDTVGHTYTAAGVYDITLTVTTVEGCVFDTTLVDAVVVHPSPQVAITVSPSTVPVEDPAVLLTGTDLGGDVVNWSWDLGVLVPGQANGPSVAATVPDVPGSYPVTLVVTTVNGCTDTLQAVVTVVAAVEMPNVFSPNGDGHNDRFVPLGLSGAQGDMSIYNRWGQLIFTTKQLAEGWPGRDEQGEVPAGTYFYIVNDAGLPGHRLKGYVTLVR